MTFLDQTKITPQAANNNEAVSQERSMSQNAASLSSLKTIKDDLAALPNGPAMNADELRSIKSLIAYFAYYAEIEKDIVASMVSAHFGTEDIEHMRSADYDAAVHYLVDLDVKNAIN